MQYTVCAHCIVCSVLCYGTLVQLARQYTKAVLEALQFSQVEQSIVRRQDVGLMGVKLMAEVSAGG